MANINYLLIENLININNIKNYFYIKHNYFSNSKNHKLPYITKNLLFIKWLNYFIIKPRKSVSDAFLLGLVIYGDYETTSYALLKNWSLITVIIDTLWGGALFAITTYVVNMLREIF